MTNYSAYSQMLHKNMHSDIAPLSRSPKNRTMLDSFVDPELERSNWSTQSYT